MRKIILCGVFCGWLGILGLANYEVAAKAPALTGTSLPDSWAAAQAEFRTPIHHHTGIRVVDRIIHEGEEAVAFYGLLGGRTSRTALPRPQLQIPQ